MDPRVSTTSCWRQGAIFSRNNWKFAKLWLISVAIYVLLFLFVCDLYFKSPIQRGLPAHRVPRPFSKRVVMFVADGLRQETMARHHDATEFLAGLRRDGRSAAGVAHTKVPTESRTGHAALLGGIYEDPSAVFSLWTSNTVEFDSVVNRSNYAWLFGSSVIVDGYGKSEAWKLHADGYQAEDQDFTGKGNDSELDKWVFEKMADVLHNRAGSCEEEGFKLRREQREYRNVKCARSCAGTVCEGGNFFLLLLPAMDSAGHIHKPHSERYLDTLKDLDFGIAGATLLVEDFFNDGETTFIFTSDHGMTDWGSHGDGSAMETEVPFVIWGKGVKPGDLAHHLDQADVAPLISILLGVAIPVNSMGFVDDGLLSGSKEEINWALWTNLAQLVENYNFLRRGYDRDYLFKEPRFFKDRDPSGFVEMLKDDISRNVSNCLAIRRVAQEVSKGIRYLSDYYFTPKMVMIWYGVVLWTVYLAVSLHQNENPIDRCWLQKFRFCRKCFYVLTATIAGICAGYTFCLQSRCFSYVYIAFPTALTIGFLANDRIIYDTFIFYQNRHKVAILFRAALILALLQLLVLGFFNKYLYGLVLYVMVIWMNNFRRVSGALQLFWFVANCGISACLLIPHSTSFNFGKFYVGIALWLLLNATTAFAFGRDGKTQLILAITSNSLTLATAVNAYMVAVQFGDDGVLEASRVSSWTLTAISLALIPFYPNQFMTKFNQICLSLSVPFILMSVDFDLTRYTLLVAWLNIWILTETQNLTIASSVTFDDHRLSFFYLAITISYFFAIGNTARFNGVDPLWTRAYVFFYHKPLMAALIVFKLITPFFLITCAYSLINAARRSNLLSTFTIVMLQLNPMILSFMVNVRNEGSWKEIGQSIAHFVVMEITAVVLLTFYLIARVIIGFSLLGPKRDPPSCHAERDNYTGTPEEPTETYQNSPTPIFSGTTLREDPTKRNFIGIAKSSRREKKKPAESQNILAPNFSMKTAMGGDLTKRNLMGIEDFVQSARRVSYVYVFLECENPVVVSKRRSSLDDGLPTFGNYDTKVICQENFFGGVYWPTAKRAELVHLLTKCVQTILAEQTSPDRVLAEQSRAATNCPVRRCFSF